MATALSATRTNRESITMALIITVEGSSAGQFPPDTSDGEPWYESIKPFRVGHRPASKFRKKARVSCGFSWWCLLLSKPRYKKRILIPIIYIMTGDRFITVSRDDNSPFVPGRSWVCLSLPRFLMMVYLYRGTALSHSALFPIRSVPFESLSHTTSACQNHMERRTRLGW
jgi:hypothetical protein